MNKGEIIMKAATHRWRGIGVLPSCGKAKASLLAAVIVFGSFFALGCRQQALYHYHYSPEGERVPFKRVAKRMSRMTLRPWSTKAYVSGGDLKIEKISEEQKQIIEDFGVPESTRVPFESLQNETVDEWLYLRHNLLVQWVDGAKVFEGPVTDIERTLVEKGYPRTSTVSQDEYGVERQTWHYRNRPDLASQVYTFTNGELSYRRTPN
jgi:hypothetical protein